MKIKKSEGPFKLVEIGTVKSGEIVNIGGDSLYVVLCDESTYRNSVSCVGLKMGAIVNFSKETKVQIDEGEFHSTTILNPL